MSFRGHQSVLTLGMPIATSCRQLAGVWNFIRTLTSHSIGHLLERPEKAKRTAHYNCALPITTVHCPLQLCTAHYNCALSITTMHCSLQLCHMIMIMSVKVLPNRRKLLYGCIW